MKEMTQKQIDRQDWVDNAIFRMMNEVNPSKKKLEWDIEKISRIRNVVLDIFLEDKICTEGRFYP